MSLLNKTMILGQQSFHAAGTVRESERICYVALTFKVQGTG